MLPPILLSGKVFVNAAPGEVWSHLYETDRMNRAIGLPPVRFTPHPESLRARYFQAEARLLGLKLSYEEQPFEWVEGRYYHVRRCFPEGPLVEYTGGVRLESRDGGTQIESFARLHPRNWLGVLLARTVGWRVVLWDIPRFAQGLRRKDGGSPIKARELMERLGRLTAMGTSPELVHLLREHMLTSSDIRTSCLRAYELADHWLKSRAKTLEMMLRAVKVGALEMRWLLLCPHCRAVSSDVAISSALGRAEQCGTCGLSYSANMKANVEVRFKMAPELRPGSETTFCVGGPANTPDVITQLKLEPWETRVETVTLAPGRIRLFCFQEGEPLSLTVPADGPSGATVDVTCERTGIVVRELISGPGSVRLRVSNRLDHECLLSIERDLWAETASVGSQVVAAPEFKALFPNEAVLRT